MAAELLTTATEQWIRDKLQLKHPYLADVRSLSLPGTYQERICHLGDALKNFVRLKVLDLSYNALVSIKGMEHLKGLERLILYSNCISSIQEVKDLDELPVLRELDLRLNPLTRLHPHYRPCLVHAMPRLCILDGRLVRETERTPAIMQFPFEPLSPKKSSHVNQAADKISSDQRLALADHLTKRLSLRTSTDDTVVNFFATNGGQGEARPLSDSVNKQTRGIKSKNLAEQRSSTQQQKTSKCIPGSCPSKYEDKESMLPHTGEIFDQITTSSNVSERPKVSFGPGEEKYESVSAEQKKNGLPIQTRHIARGYYTPNPNHHSNSALVNIRPPSLQRGLSLSDPSNPILLPPRLTYCTVNKTEGGPSIPQQEGKRTRGGYRKPLEMLLNLVDKHWTGERSLHHHNNFLSQAVHILSIMEKDISTRESEVETLRGKVDTLNFRASAQTEEHRMEVRNLSAQLQEARSEVFSLREQLRVVLEENVSLQKQLLNTEQRYGKSTMRTSPIIQVEEVKTKVETLRKEIEVLKERVEETEKVQGLSSLQ